MRLQNKTAIVTGGASGFGAGIVKKFVAEGARVIVADINGAAAEALASELGALAQQVDISKSDSVKALAEKAFAEFGTLDILVNNAGVSHMPAPLDEISEADFDRVIAVNVKSVYLTAHFIVPHMKANQWGRIVNIASVSAKQPIEGLLVSNAVRSGVLGFAKSIATEFAPYNITVNTVLPGYTETHRLAEMIKEKAEFKKQTPQEMLKGMQDQIPMGRLAKPHEIASLVAFLASQPASYVTGQAIAADGGWIRGV